MAIRYIATLITIVTIGGSGVWLHASPRTRPVISAPAAARLLYPPVKRKRRRRKPFTAKSALKKCPQADTAARIQCMLRTRYRRDRRAYRMVRKIYVQSGWVVGLEPAWWMNGGWRGRVRIVPQLPIRRYRYHLRYLQKTVRDYRFFFKNLILRKYT